MFRENLRANEIKLSHDLSARIYLKRTGRIIRFDNDSPDSKVEMKYAG